MITTGIFKSAYRLRNLKASGIISADSAADARICEGRRAISFGNASNFSRHGSGAKDFRHHQRPDRAADQRRQGMTEDVADERQGRRAHRDDIGSCGRIVVP